MTREWYCIAFDVPMHARLDSGSSLTRRALRAFGPGAACRQTRSFKGSTQGRRAAAEGTVARQRAHSGNTLKGSRPYVERLHIWNQCTVCGTPIGSHPSSASCGALSSPPLSHPSLHGSGDGDGILVCETCQGQGIVATKVSSQWAPSTFLYMRSHTGVLDPPAYLQPGGAGVPFYIGNAQCSACKGLGFEPCPVCMGYQAELRPPDPCNGPASRDSSDLLVNTRRWLQSFPDSRRDGRARRQVTAMPVLQRSGTTYTTMQRREACELYLGLHSRHFNRAPQ